MSIDPCGPRVGTIYPCSLLHEPPPPILCRLPTPVLTLLGSSTPSPCSSLASLTLFFLVTSLTIFISQSSRNSFFLLCHCLTMKYVKPLQLFMETQKRCLADNWLLGLTSTARHLCWALIDGYGTDIELYDYYPHKTKCIVEKLSWIQNEKSGKVIGIVAGKNHVGPPMDFLIDDLCKSGKFQSLKYTYWADNILSVNSESLSESYVEQYNKLISPKSKRDDIDGFSACRMLQGYMDLWSSLVERPKRCDLI